MISDYPVATARVGGRPVLHILTAFPIACFTGALATDVTYVATANMLWADFSAWLLAAGEAFGVLAALAGLGALFATRRVPRTRPAWPVALGCLVVLALGLLNNFVHSRDAWTSVMPEGLVLSVLTVVVMLATAWFGYGTVYMPVLTAAPGIRP